MPVFWPCWEWLSRPQTRFLFASYASQDVGEALRDAAQGKQQPRSDERSRDEVQQE